MRRCHGNTLPLPATQRGKLGSYFNERRQKRSEANRCTRIVRALRWEVTTLRVAKKRLLTNSHTLYPDINLLRLTHFPGLETTNSEVELQSKLDLAWTVGYL
jgi:hypothetical protein